MTEKERNKKKKEYLNSYRFTCNRINILERQIEELRESKEQAKTQEITDMPSGNKKTDLSDYIVRLEQLEEKAKAKCDECRSKKIDIENKILDVDSDIESGILYKRYVKLQSWENISNEIGYCTRQVLRYHGNALQKIDIQDVAPSH